MAYPAPSDWNSSATLAAYVFEGDQLKATDGYSALYSFWGAMGGISDAMRVYDLDELGRRVPLDLAATAPPGEGALAWDDNMLRWLRGAAEALRAPNEFIDAVIDDRATRTISPTTVQTFVWVTWTNERVNQRGDIVYGFGSPADINVPKGTILPVYGAPISRGPNVSWSLTSTTVPISAQPERLPPRISPATGSFAVAAAFLAVLAIGGAVILSTVPKRTVTRRTR